MTRHNWVDEDAFRVGELVEILRADPHRGDSWIVGRVVASDGSLGVALNGDTVVVRKGRGRIRRLRKRIPPWLGGDR